MYYVSKRMEIAGSHQLNLNYESKCQNLHGHNWIVVVNGMVVDFTHVKQLVHDKLDHAHINDVVSFNPTAENMARWICEQVPNCFMVEVQESEGNIATYEK